VKVVREDGRNGLVPASYLETPGEESSRSPIVQLGTGEHGRTQRILLRTDRELTTSAISVRAIYPYQAQGGDELDLQEGEVLELSSGPSGGKNFGNGWWEGERGADGTELF